ncbi:N-acetyllactosaminide beta-1,3-N-acetylglucosaminyltransferase 2 [Denticeps clupeoides]|uniref:Hexosyltransferase n=1 Tax=Denticeps clupeoides TaxID=299321 RepID=A0AAY4A5S5_9TELE|nr:N-acetyllactosaminide beta-1,3-N-acetylglucosaminyltransferase 2-like [Denticeps clupeoides]XP_028839760.1 N-acetyllactosaminide beta-1,3-N-acetylglucosaminyltransferase 2-like [Denticeps clupeoides]
MARCKCNGQVLCLVLLPCMVMGHLLVYILVSIFVAISYHSSSSSVSPPQLPSHFIASGASRNTSALASHPLSPFWNLRLEEGALWNQLQHLRDREHNPILRGANSTKFGLFLEGRNSSPPCGPQPRWASLLQDFNSLSEQMKDFVLSMDCRTYPVLIDQPELCRVEDKGQAPVLLMAIKSQVGNFENRQAIRETWGRSGWVEAEDGRGSGLVRTVFLLGRQDAMTGPHPDLGPLLDLESSRNGDILQWDFRDTFFNLTLKDVLFWDWFAQNCPYARFIFKGDDDVFIRTDSLLEYLHSQSAKRVKKRRTQMGWDFVVGDVISNAWPNRRPDTKYYIPESFYKGAYPAYAGGGGVVYSNSLALQLRGVSRRVHLFPIDDVYLGMCLHRLGISPTHHAGFLTFDLPEREKERPCAYRSVILVHKRSPKQMLTLWNDLRESLSEC